MINFLLKNSQKFQTIWKNMSMPDQSLITPKNKSVLRRLLNQIIENSSAEFSGDDVESCYDLLDLILIHIEKEKLKINGSHVYSPVITHNGHNTQTYQKKQTVQEFCIDWYRWIELFDFSKTCATKNYRHVEACVESLSKTQSELILNPKLFSFLNGLYFIDGPEFVKYDQLSANHKKLVSCKFLATDFVHCQNWRDMTHPTLTNCSNIRG
jgi:hypothetical protein